MMNFIAVICVFVGGYGVRWLCEVMQEVRIAWENMILILWALCGL